MQSADVIVLGVGGMGSAACYHLAKRGVSVLGIEQYSTGHDRGSSHGDTRIIRQAYFEHADYVPLLKRAYELWNSLSEECGQKLFHKTGVVFFGEVQSNLITLILKSATLHGIPVQVLDREQAVKKWPGYVPPQNFQAVFEPGAGYLEVENCVRAHASLAKKMGATIVSDQKVLEWREQNGEITVVTDKNTYHAKKLVVTAGAWNKNFLKDLNISLKVHRNIALWYKADDRYLKEKGMPCFGMEVPEGFIYGFPQIDEFGVKVALHKPGNFVEDAYHVDREVHASDRTIVESCLKKYLPGLDVKKPLKQSVCFYTMSKDEHFIIDKHPQHKNVVFAAGFSGHGFKFASVVGEILADLAQYEKTSHPIKFLNLR